MIFKLKKNFISFFGIFIIINLLIFSSESIVAVKKGLELWINNVVPSLFPFFVATEILIQTNFVGKLGKILQKPVSKIFNVPGEGAFVLIMGMICGYPSGAKIVSNLKKQGILTLEESERLISFTNNSGPLFILGTVGVSLLNNSKIGYILLFSHIISCILVGIIFRNWKKEKIKKYRDDLNFVNDLNKMDFGEILGKSISSSIVMIVNIGGFIVIFSVIISIFNQLLNLPQCIGKGVFYGLIELTNGLKIISELNFSKVNSCIISFLLGFGGLSVLFQVKSIISKEKISIKPYVLGKILQGIFSSVITYILIF